MSILVEALRRKAARSGVNRSLAAAVIATALAFSCTSAHAGAFLEIGDAGQTPGTAQPVTTLTPNDGSLTSIVGSLPTIGDSDVYRIRIDFPAIFSASITTINSLADTQIYLFDENGVGIAFNDDTPGGSDFNATLPQGNALYASLPAGIYLLGITSYDNDPYINFPPLNESDYVFPFNSNALSQQVSGPNPSAVGIPFVDFDTTLGNPWGEYTIHLTGANAVPEPTALAFLGFGALAALRRRTRA